MEWKSLLIHQASKLSSHIEIRYYYSSSSSSSSNALSLHHFLLFPSPKTLASTFPNPNPNSPLLSSYPFPISPSSHHSRNPNPNSSFRISNRNPNPSFHLLGKFSISSAIFLSSLSLDTLAFGRNPNPKFLHSIASSLSSSLQLSKSLVFISSSRKSKNSSNLFSVRSLSMHSKTPISRRKPNPDSRLTRKQQPQFDSPIVSPDEFAEILGLIERGEIDMELKLNQLQRTPSIVSVSKILGSLNDRGVSALRYFDWVRKTQSEFIPTSEMYNLIIDNLGRVEDYETMFVLLSKLSLNRHCLTEKAFGFLTVCSSDIDRIGDSVERVVETLSRVRGSCRSSGIYALIKTLCAMNYFDQARFVMEETARKTSYYNVLIAAKCRNGDFQEALDLFDEMKRFGCDPNTKSYNYLLGSLCKKGKIAEVCELIEVMEKLGYLPDSVTFEIVTVHACRVGNMDFAIEFLYHMMSEGLEPRITTHAAFIKGYFWSGQAGDAYKYVVEMSSKNKCSANMNYSLLASLFHKSGRVVEAREILIEMIEKGLKPNFPVYMRVMKDLFKLGKGDLVADLKGKFSRFHSSTEDG